MLPYWINARQKNIKSEIKFPAVDQKWISKLKLLKRFQLFTFSFSFFAEKSEKVEYPCLTSNITRINSVIHFTQNTVCISVNQSQTELYWGC